MFIQKYIEIIMNLNKNDSGLEFQLIGKDQNGRGVIVGYLFFYFYIFENYYDKNVKGLFI